MSDIIVSGMRPTGALHIGHYVGVLKNWIEYQNTHECFYFVADWHAVTSNYDNLAIVHAARKEYVRGWVAAGIDPNKAHIYNQSSIPEVLFLNQIFLSLTPPGWADRSPSWKDLKTNPSKKLDNLGFYNYPILQTADVAIVNGKFVPVGEDQVAHLEIGREIIRKFNRLYKTQLPEPVAKLTAVPKLLGIDGSKMSSSLGNVISLNESVKSLQKKVNKMKTDDLRGGVEKPGNPDNCSVFSYHKIFSSQEAINDVNQSCRGAQLSCGECKQNLGKFMQEELMPISEKMGKITDDQCEDILTQGNRVVGEKAKALWQELKIQIKL